MSSAYRRLSKKKHRSFSHVGNAADDVAIVWFEKKIVYRLISAEHEEKVKELFRSGLIGNLVRSNLMPRTEISAKKFEGFNLVIEQERLSPIIYPFEWSPEMLRSAALCVINVNKKANAYGYELKDAHPYNIVYNFGVPQWVDLGSIVEIRVANRWRAHNEFLQCYHWPLSLVERGLESIFPHVFLLSGTRMSTVDLAVISKPFFNIIGRKNTRSVLKVLDICQARDAYLPENGYSSSPRQLMRMIVQKSLNARQKLLRRSIYEGMETRIKSYNLTRKTQWGSYHSDAGIYAPSGAIVLPPRMNRIKDLIAELAPRTILELAGNQGALSRELSRLPSIEWVVCTDNDSQAIDEGFIRVEAHEKIFMACFDCMADVQAQITDEREKRFKAELVLALAVTHHLILTAGYSLHYIFETIASFSSKFVMIEFMPLGLWSSESPSSLPPVPHWYTEEWFAAEFEQRFDVILREQLDQNRVLYVGKCL